MPIIYYVSPVVILSNLPRGWSKLERWAIERSGFYLAPVDTLDDVRMYKQCLAGRSYGRVLRDVVVLFLRVIELVACKEILTSGDYKLA